jgi:glycosyltransferase involved in cell wall biosynthesis
MVGLPWEQHVAFLEDRNRVQDIIRRVKEAALACNKHSAILCYAIGNEIPAPVVRWYGRKKIESFLKELYKVVKKVHPESLVTYVNYPTTEYLHLSFLDFDCFNVYLETPDKLSKYIARLHNLSGDRPLVLAEIGMDSLRNGDNRQAALLQWQIETIYGKGAAGMFVFAWTDEWWRGGSEILDWHFGLVDRNRNPKPALYAVRAAMKSVPVHKDAGLPFISVIVCSYNGSATIRETLNALQHLVYPNFEVIVVNDGSTDNLAEIANSYPVKLVTTKNQGLSNARNTGMYHAEGEIIAYVDDDAYPDPHWLLYIAYAYLTSKHDCIGGPNISPLEDGDVSTCVANAPGGPLHVLETDEVAEHVPGCNMTFRKKALMRIGGFDPTFRTAGDDVDACWRIQQQGGTVGFHPSAVVWHHRRNSIKAFWRQQIGYGKAEALLEEKWPEKYNAMGHITWAGRIYGNGFTLPIKLKKEKIFYGIWGTAPFQSVYQPARGFWHSIPQMPEWYLLCGCLALLSSLGFVWPSLLWAWPAFVASISITVIQAVISAYHNSMLPPDKRNLKCRMLIIFLHLIQPMARLYGRLKHGLTPWRKRGAGVSSKFLLAFKPKIFSHWSEQWRAPEDWLTDVERNALKLKNRVCRGKDFDRWDLQVKNGLFGNAKCLFVVEEHGQGKQYVQVKSWNEYSTTGLLTFLVLISISCWAALNQEWLITSFTALIGLACMLQCLLDAASAMNSIYVSVASLEHTKEVIFNEVKSTEAKPVMEEDEMEENNQLVSEEPLFKVG